FSRVCYSDYVSQVQAVWIPSANSRAFRSTEVSLQELLARVPELAPLYKMTFGTESHVAFVNLSVGHVEEQFLIRIDDPELYSDRDSLRRIVQRWRAKFPFLQKWRIFTVQQAWGNS